MATPLHCCGCKCKCAQIYGFQHRCMPTLIFPCGCPAKRSPKPENDQDNEKYDSPTGSQRYAAIEHKQNSDDNMRPPRVSDASEDMDRLPDGAARHCPQRGSRTPDRTSAVQERHPATQDRPSTIQQRHPATQDRTLAIPERHPPIEDRTSAIQDRHPSLQERQGRTPSAKLSVVVRTVESVAPRDRMDDSIHEVRNLDPPHHGQLKTEESSKVRSQYPNQKNVPKFRESTVVVTYQNSGHSQDSTLPREHGSRITETSSKEYLLATENLNDNPAMHRRPEDKKSSTCREPRETRETATSPPSIYCVGNASAPGYCYNSDSQSPKKLERMLDKMSRGTSSTSVKSDKQKCCPKRSKKHTAIKRKDSHQKTTCCKKKRPKAQKSNHRPFVPPDESQNNFSPKEQYELLSKVANENSKLKRELSSFYDPPKTKPSPVMKTQPSKARPNIQPCRNVGTCTRKKAFLGMGGRPSQISAQLANPEKKGLTVCLCEGDKNRKKPAKLRVLKKPSDKMSTTSSTGSTKKCCPSSSKRKKSPKRAKQSPSKDNGKTKIR